jgi:hypothetical protein
VNSLHARVLILVSRRRHPHSFGQIDITATPSGVIGSPSTGPAQGVMHTIGSLRSNSQVNSKIWLDNKGRFGDTEDDILQWT